jgi:hypothetical protein
MQFATLMSRTAARIRGRIGQEVRLAIVLLSMLSASRIDASVSSLATGSALPHFTTAAAAREWSEAVQQTGNFALAAQGFYREAAMRRAEGDEQAAEVEELRASRLSTTVSLAVPVVLSQLQQHLAKLEPAEGCYIGVRDEERDHDLGDTFARQLGRPISVTYDYLAYGQPFPIAWARRQASEGRAIQIAWEPANIACVLDDEYLEGFASDAAHCGTGVFLRFGGEMNGFWTPWGRSPTLYKQAFRTVHDVMARIAPNVAMVWAPNQIPLANLDLYYPGDACVDWVGISLYTVRFYDDDPSRPAYQDNPATMIDPIYRRFASRKPICLAECGITRRSRIENVDADDFAGARLTDLLNAVRVRFPRLKMLCFFDQDNLTGAAPNRRLNDYSLPDGSLALAAVKQAAADPYFLSRFREDAGSPIGYEQVTTTLPRNYSGPIMASIITYDLHPTMLLSQAHKTQTLYRPYVGQVNSSAGPVNVTVTDSHGKVVQSIELALPLSLRN